MQSNQQVEKFKKKAKELVGEARLKEGELTTNKRAKIRKRGGKIVWEAI